MALGRHLGLKSRLLDWSSDICQAMSFAAAEEEVDTKGCLWILCLNGGSDFKDENPFESSEEVLRFFNQSFYSNDGMTPREFSEGIYRRFSQHGRFTTTDDRTMAIPLEENEYVKTKYRLIKIPVSPEFKKKFRISGLCRDGLNASLRCSAKRIEDEKLERCVEELNICYDRMCDGKNL